MPCLELSLLESLLMNDTPTPAHIITLRELPMAARLTLALFLLSVGIGYVSAMVQLHFQDASPGELLPSGDDAVKKFHGHVGAPPQSRLEQLLPEAFEGKKMNGQGQMTAAFFKRSEDWGECLSDKAKALAKHASGNPKDPVIKEAAEAELRQEREGERLAMVAWVRAGASEAEYNDDKSPLPEGVAKRPITHKYLVEDGDQIVEPRCLKIKTLFQERCCTCHGEGGEAQSYPLLKYSDIKKYTAVQTATAISLTKLAQTTHVHLLGFSMLYGLTGLILAFSTYPRALRLMLCPLPLLAQVIDIGFWWLARLPDPYGPQFARDIVFSGGVVALGLVLQIVLSLFNLFSRKAWIVLILLLATAAGGGLVLKQRVIDPFIQQERTSIPATE
jgi:hypothetical protein